jgi:hypothetical protein
MYLRAAGTGQISVHQIFYHILWDSGQVAVSYLSGCVSRRDETHETIKFRTLGSRVCFLIDDRPERACPLRNRSFIDCQGVCWGLQNFSGLPAPLAEVEFLKIRSSTSLSRTGDKLRGACS